MQHMVTAYGYIHIYPCRVAAVYRPPFTIS